MPKSRLSAVAIARKSIAKRQVPVSAGKKRVGTENAAAIVAEAGADRVVLLTDLLHRAAQRADRDVERALLPYGLTARQFSVLNAIFDTPGLWQIQLSSTTGIDRSTIVNIVDRLERRRLVVRTQSKFDRRAVALQLTEHGLAITARARPLVESIHKNLIAMLPQQARSQLTGLLLLLLKTRAD